jgi:hypothetical protein
LFSSDRLTASRSYGAINVNNQIKVIVFVLQCKNVDTLSKELDLPTSQLLGLFNTLLRKMTAALRSIYEKSIEASLNIGGGPKNPLAPRYQFRPFFCRKFLDKFMS